jgi:glycosyltransferase involved in cell wall biosynthesis
MVCHNYLPGHAAGTEVYTAELAARLAGLGHAVSVFTTEKDIARADLSLTEREHAGIPVTEVTNNLYYRRFEQTWEQPEITALFAAHLDRLAPDLVHFQHLMYLSLGCVEEARARGLGVVFTLHDYWLHCARFGQRVHADGSLCPTIDFDRCGGCLAGFKFGQTSLERATGRVIAGVKGVTGVDLSGAAKGASRALARETQKPAGDAAPIEGVPAGAAERAVEVAERDAAVRARVVPNVHRFLSPSRFLLERFVEWGIPAERIAHLPTGLDPRFASASEVEREGDGPVRIAFIGSLVPLKAPHLLLEAWGLLPGELRASATLELFGPSKHHPDYQRRLAALASEVGAQLCGALERDEVARVLTEVDLIVVPSTWYENAPLVILEALAVHTPLLVSDAGGMAELVADGRNGLHFRLGDAADLARKLELLLADRARLAALRQGAPVRSVEDVAREVEAVYAEVVASK